MIDIPNCLEKYRKFLETCPLVDSISSERLSDSLLEHINKSKDGQLFLKRKKGINDFDYFIPDLQDIPSCFLENVWKNCTLEDKIKITDRYLDYFFQNCPSIRPTLQLIPKSKNDLDEKTLGYYSHSKKRLCINLDKVINDSGIQFLSVIYHECTHVKDFDRIENEILPNLLKEYSNVGIDVLQYPRLCDRAILKMKTTGVIQNKQTGEKQFIESKLKNDILRAKNFFVHFKFSNMDSLSKVNSKDDFRQYVQSILYYYSPIERFARTSVKRYFKEQLKNKDCISATDQVFMSMQFQNEAIIDNFIQEFKDLLMINGTPIIEMKDFFDLAMQYKFYFKPTYMGQNNAMKYPKEAERVKVAYERAIDKIYSNFVMKRFINPDRYEFDCYHNNPYLKDENER